MEKGGERNSSKDSTLSADGQQQQQLQHELLTKMSCMERQKVVCSCSISLMTGMEKNACRCGHSDFHPTAIALGSRALGSASSGQDPLAWLEISGVNSKPYAFLCICYVTHTLYLRDTRALPTTDILLSHNSCFARFPAVLYS